MASDAKTSAADGTGSAGEVGSTLPPAAQESLARWLDMLGTGELGDLPSILAEDAVLHSPVGLKPYPGRDLVCLVLRTAASVLEGFEYRRIATAGDTAMLELHAHIGGMELKGVHLLRFDGLGKVVDVESLVRPSKAGIELGNRIGDKAGTEIKALRDRA